MLISKECFERGCSCYDDRVDKDPVEVVEREWVGLTDQEVEQIADSEYEEAFVRLVEAKLKEKNNG